VLPRVSLAIGHNKVGDALQARGDANSALEAYTKALQITRALVAADPANRQWQRDLAICHNRRGKVLDEAGEDPEAVLQAYREGQVIAESLVCLDPDNGEWQADLAISFDRIGDVLLRQGDPAGALPLFHRALKIRCALVARDPETSPWLRNLFVSHLNVADTLTAQQNPEAARLACRIALAIADQLLSRAPDDPQTRFDRAEAAYKLYVAITAEPSGLGAGDAQLLNSSRKVVAELSAIGWPLPQQSWVQALLVK